MAAGLTRNSPVPSVRFYPLGRRHRDCATGSAPAARTAPPRSARSTAQGSPWCHPGAYRARHTPPFCAPCLRRVRTDSMPRFVCRQRCCQKVYRQRSHPEASSVSPFPPPAYMKNATMCGSPGSACLVRCRPNSGRRPIARTRETDRGRAEAKIRCRRKSPNGRVGTNGRSAPARTPPPTYHLAGDVLRFVFERVGGRTATERRAARLKGGGDLTDAIHSLPSPTKAAAVLDQIADRAIPFLAHVEAW